MEGFTVNLKTFLGLICLTNAATLLKGNVRLVFEGYS